MIQLKCRSEAKECLDDFLVDQNVLRATFQQLKKINEFTLGYWPTMSTIRYFLERYGRNRVINILDIGCGDGETLRRIDDYGRTRKFSLRLKGIDLNKQVIALANEENFSKDINFIHGDALANDSTQVYDLIISSLTMHHLKDEDIIKLMHWMSLNARIGWFISDLHRHPMAYYFIKYFVRLGKFNRYIRHDAPLSVARGFRRQDWNKILSNAQFNHNDVRISWYPNFRYGIRYEKFL